MLVTSPATSQSPCHWQNTSAGAATIQSRDNAALAAQFLLLFIPFFETFISNSFHAHIKLATDKGGGLPDASGRKSLECFLNINGV